MQVNFWKYSKKIFLKYKQKKKKQGLVIFLQFEAFLNSKLPNFIILMWPVLIFKEDISGLSGVL